MAVAPKPLVFVPGITGSYIYFPFSLIRLISAAAFQKVLWPNPQEILNGGIEKMRFEWPGYPAPTPNNYLLPGGPLGPYYGGLWDYLRANNYRIITFAMDWRRQVAIDGINLANVIRANTDLGATPPVQCYIVAHSRGGLVTRYALSVLAGTGELGRVKRVVGLGVPHRGSILAVDNLNGPWGWANDLSSLTQRIGSLTGGVLDAGNVQAALRSWPSVYELLPDPVRTWLDPVEVAKLYVQANWLPIPAAVIGQLLTAAQSAWAALPDPDPSVGWLNVVGIGYPTPVGAATAAEMIAHESEISEDQGDGVVPVQSATLPNRPTLTVPTSHGALGYDQRNFQRVVAYLDTGDQNSYTLPGEPNAVPGGWPGAF